MAPTDAVEENPDAVPKSQFKPPPVVPAEEYGKGVNKKIYFVCSERKCSLEAMYLLATQLALSGSSCPMPNQTRLLLLARYASFSLAVLMPLSSATPRSLVGKLLRFFHYW